MYFSWTNSSFTRQMVDEEVHNVHYWLTYDRNASSSYIFYFRQSQQTKTQRLFKTNYALLPMQVQTRNSYKCIFTSLSFPSLIVPHYLYNPIHDSYKTLTIEIYDLGLDFHLYIYISLGTKLANNFLLDMYIITVTYRLLGWLLWLWLINQVPFYFCQLIIRSWLRHTWRYTFSLIRSKSVIEITWLC